RPHLLVQPLVAAPDGLHRPEPDAVGVHGLLPPDAAAQPTRLGASRRPHPLRPRELELKLSHELNASFYSHRGRGCGDWFAARLFWTMHVRNVPPDLHLVARGALRELPGALVYLWESFCVTPAPESSVHRLMQTRAVSWI